MSEFRLPDGGVYTPFRIFVRAVGYYADQDLLSILGFTNYRPIDEPPATRRVLLIDEQGPWIIVCDDWYYTIWNRPETDAAIEVLASKHEVFTTDVGDTDRSYSFSHFLDGSLRRKIRCEDHGRNARHKVVSDIGTPSGCEIDARALADEMMIVDRVADCYGIPLPKYDSVRFHSSS